MNMQFCVIGLFAVHSLALCSSTVQVSLHSKQKGRGSESQKQTDLTVNGFNLFIKSNKRSYHVDEDIVLATYLKNTNKMSEQVERTSSLGIYSIEVIKPDQQKAELSPLGKEMKIQQRSSKSTLSLTSGQSFPVSFELNKLFDMAMPGIYKVHVARKVNSIAHPSFVDAPSNEIELEVK